MVYGSPVNAAESSQADSISTPQRKESMTTEELTVELARVNAQRLKLADHPAKNAKQLQRLNRRAMAIEIELKRKGKP